MKKLKRLVQGVALGGTLALAAGLIAPATAHAAGPAFDPDNAAVFIGWGDPTRLDQAVLNADGSNFDLEPVGPASGRWNALGFNTIDNYLYAVASANGQVLQIGSDGVPEALGKPDGLPAGANLNHGTFGSDDHAGLLIAAPYSPGDNNSLYAIDLRVSGVAGEAKTFQLSQGLPNLSDFVYRDGFIWGYNGFTNNNFYRIDMNGYDFDGAAFTANVEVFDASELGLPAQPYGAQWLYGNGNIGISNNVTGRVYQVAINDDDLEAPTFSLVSSATGQATSNNDGASIMGLPADLAIEKSGDELFAPGEPYTYTITVTNEGLGNSTGSIVTDTLPAGLENPVWEGAGCEGADGVLTCNVGPISVGDSLEFTVSGTASADATDADMVNSVSVVGNEADPNPGNNEAMFGPVIPDPSFTLTKTATPDPITPNDKVVDYTFVVTNTGNVSLTDVNVSDPGPVGGQGEMSAITCEDDELAVDTSFECTATYTLDPADITGEPLENEATATAKDPSGNTLSVVAPAVSVTETILPVPELELVKSAEGGPATEAGQEITYSFEVTNTGNVDVENVVVSEGEFTGQGTLGEVICPAEDVALLAVDDSVTCVATYTVVEADLTGEDIENTATASGETPFGAVESEQAQAAVPTAPAPEAKLELVKTAAGGPATKAGQEIIFSFEVTNTGNVDVENVEVQEQEFSGKGKLSSVVCPTEEAALLAVDASVTCEATYTVAQADLTGNDIENLATAVAEAPAGPVESEPAGVNVPTVAPEAPGDALPATGGQSLMLAGGIALLLVAAGATIVVMARRKAMS